MNTGQANLQDLLRSIEPELRDRTYVFCTVPDEMRDELESRAVLLFREREGLTAVLPKTDAERIGIDYAFPSRMITLTVHSSLYAVGLLAAVTQVLAQADISVNVVSAFYHDYLFVPEHRAVEALQILSALSEQATQ